MKTLWIVEHNIFGFTGISAGDSLSDIDNYLSYQDLDNLFQEVGIGRKMCEYLDMCFNLPSPTLPEDFWVESYLKDKGWIPSCKNDYTNKDIIAEAFVKND